MVDRLKLLRKSGDAQEAWTNNAELRGKKEPETSEGPGESTSDVQGFFDFRLDQGDRCKV